MRTTLLLLALAASCAHVAPCPVCPAAPVCPDDVEHSAPVVRATCNEGEAVPVDGGLWLSADCASALDRELSAWRDRGR